MATGNCAHTMTHNNDNIMSFEMRKLHFLKIPYGFDFKFNYSDK